MNDPGNIENATGADLLHLIGALPDDTVKRIVAVAGGLLEVAEQLNKEETKKAVIYSLHRLAQSHRSGSLEIVFDMVDAAHCLRMAMTDPMINRLLGFIEHMVNNLASEELATVVNKVFAALQDAVDDAKDAPVVKGGIFGTIRQLSKPETQQTIQFMLALSEKVKEHFRNRD